MGYLAIKQAHIAFAVISISFFLIRAWWSWRESPVLQQRWVKITPHINDTLLLGCAVYLMIVSQQYPFVHGWLTAKIVALLVYIGLGMMAIKRGRTPQVRLLTAIGAACCFGYMFMVARAHNPWPF